MFCWKISLAWLIFDLTAAKNRPAKDGFKTD
jgi:hypothetical protein